MLKSIINMNYILLAVIAIVFLILFLIVVFVLKSKTLTTPDISVTTHAAKVFGHNIHYKIEGKGPTLVLVHGIGASHYVWRYITPFLKDHYTIVAIDLLGFGASDKPSDFLYDLDSQTAVVLEFLRSINVKKAYLLGSSMGGAICLKLAQISPALFPKIVTISPAADPSLSLFDINKLSFVTPFVSPIIGEQFIKQILKRVNSGSKKFTPEDVKIYYHPYKKADAIHSFIKSFSLLRDKRIYDDLDKVQQPVLILWGKKDKIIPIKHTRKIISKLPNAKLEVHDSAGHHVQEDEPEWVSQKIRKFLA